MEKKVHELNCTGPVRVQMTNDYLFKALMQSNERVRVSLICALLHLRPEAVKQADILNPIILGESVDEKTVIMDVRVLLDEFQIDFGQHSGSDQDRPCHGRGSDV